MNQLQITNNNIKASLFTTIYTIEYFHHIYIYIYIYIYNTP